MDNIRDHSGLIARLGGAAKVAGALGALPGTVRAWNARNRIPPEYWAGVIEAAQIADTAIDADWLMRTVPARRSASETERVPA